MRITPVTVVSLELRRRGVRVRDLAEALGRNTVGLYPAIGGHRKATIPERAAIAEFLGAQVAELFDDEGFALKA